MRCTLNALCLVQSRLPMRGLERMLSFVCSIVYRLKSVGALKMKFVAPMPEQSNTPTMHDSPENLLKCIVMVSICSGMGATNLKFWVLRRQTTIHKEQIKKFKALFCNKYGILHFRGCIFPFYLRSKSPISVMVFCFMLSMALFNGYLQCSYHTLHAVYPIGWITSTPFIIGKKYNMNGLHLQANVASVVC